MSGGGEQINPLSSTENVNQPESHTPLVILYVDLSCLLYSSSGVSI